LKTTPNAYVQSRKTIFASASGFIVHSHLTGKEPIPKQNEWRIKDGLQKNGGQSLGVCARRLPSRATNWVIARGSKNGSPKRRAISETNNLGVKTLGARSENFRQDA
jgi:hypothetical protein